MVNNSAALDDEYRALAPIVNAADKFFLSLKDSKYETAWELLTASSHKAIISDVYDSSRKVNGEIEKEEIRKDFNSGGKMFTNYWNSFHRSFNFDMILENSEWEMGVVGKEEATIIIRHNNSEAPTLLRMRKEDDSWKVGLAETFWQRKSLNFLHFIFQ
ncbi:MAG: hypothetical protein C4581_14000 [Nitrospiraceae bacterium]|nr:MAG: hypothetical protein C4581_14000 [Nitrospiraceae bacterium]